MNAKEWKAIMKKLAKVNPQQFPSHVKDLKRLNEQIKVPHPPPVNPIDEMIPEEMMGGEEDFEQMELVAEEVNLIKFKRKTSTTHRITIL